MSKEEGPPHTRTCSGCVGFTDRVKERQVELTVETVVQQVLCDGTDSGPDCTQIHDSTPQNNSHAQTTDSTLPSDQQVRKENFMSRQLISCRISEEVMPAEEGEGLVVKKTLTPPPTENN